MQGTVKWFNETKGFGFIKGDGDAKDYFVHHRNIISEKTFKTLLEGQRVEFSETKSEKGPVAMNVKIIP